MLISPIENTEANICRICLTSSAEEQNPMISICKCKGSMNLIHLKCLKSWISHKLTVKEITKKMGISYIVKSYNCEICKEPYPSKIQLTPSPNQTRQHSLQSTYILYPRESKLCDPRIT